MTHSYFKYNFIYEVYISSITHSVYNKWNIYFSNL
jgi:hypothetical protein